MEGFCERENCMRPCDINEHLPSVHVLCFCGGNNKRIYAKMHFSIMPSVIWSRSMQKISAQYVSFEVKSFLVNYCEFQPVVASVNSSMRFDSTTGTVKGRTGCCQGWFKSIELYRTTAFQAIKKRLLSQTHFSFNGYFEHLTLCFLC